ncbi:MAG: acetyl-CoA carboxylase biotin carboxyl carrier protein [Planctomycetes bacterium]|nr:acetyl-CoA carboxylase biotin carboxyl carrier protein [Planctomycetota bacterium]
MSDNLKKVQEVIDLMKENDLIEVEIVDGDKKILVKRPSATAPVVTGVPMAAAPVAPAAGTVPAADTDEGLEDITSPIVGTFYASPSPDSKAFVAVGDHVDADSVVCIIEAMKVMNEIKAEASGTIVKVVCKAGEAVEFGQALFKITPDR